jgi:hypothetical protein
MLFKGPVSPSGYCAYWAPIVWRPHCRASRLITGLLTHRITCAKLPLC